MAAAAGAVSCGACGAKIREDRTRCLRCGAPIGERGVPSVAAAPAGGRRVVSARGMSARTAAVAAALVSLGGFAALLGGAATAVGRTSPVPIVAAATVSDVTPAQAAAPPFPGSQAADDTAVSLDASRAGVAAYSRGDIGGSLQQFTAAVEADPDNPQALNNLGQALVRTGQVRAAIPHFDRAIALSGGVWAYHFNRARAYAELREWGHAIPGYRDAARLFPDDYVTAFNLARALEASGNLPDAIDEFERAIALAPGEADFHLSHAHALELAARPREAAAAYRRFLELDGSSPSAERVAARAAQLESAAP